MAVPPTLINNSPFGIMSMSDPLPLITAISAVALLCVGVWSWLCDRTSFVGRLLLFGMASCLAWAISLELLVQSGASTPFRLIWLPSVTLTASAIFMLSKVANDPAWRPPPWLVIAIATEAATVSILTLANDTLHIVSKHLGNTHLEYAWGFGIHTLFCFILLSGAALEMNRRISDPVPWMRAYSTMIMILVIATCTVQVLQIRVSQVFAAIALIACAFATHRGGLGHRDPALAQGFDPNDPVTGVLSRRSIEQLLNQLALRRPALCHVLVIDVDRFKGVNDSFGHLVGDQVLATVARRMCDQDSRLALGRWGGDEFVGILRGVPLDEVPHVAEELAAVCASSPVQIDDGRTVAISVSIGTAPCEGDDWHAWVAKADAAMYANKDRGRGNYPNDRRQT